MYTCGVANTYLGRHKSERVHAAEEAHTNANDEHETGQRQDGGEQRDQPDVRPAGRGG